MADGDIEMLREAFARVTAGDIGVASEVLDPMVRWHGAGDPGAPGSCHNRGEALSFIRNALANGTSVELLDVREAGDRFLLVLRREQADESGERPDPHGELITLREGKVIEMVVYPTVDEALADAGLAPH